MLLAANAFFDPIVHALGQVLTLIHHVIPSYGWALIALAFVVRVVLWPLTAIQFRSMAEMQKVQPLVKQLQAKYKGDPQTLNTQMMALYKEHKVNPLAGCVPMLIQFPILIGLYWAIQGQIDQFKPRALAVDRLVDLPSAGRTSSRATSPCRTSRCWCST